jgi:hypothetical protein
MVKAIKFNLTLNNKLVRDLDDLFLNFNLDDLLDLYQKKLLERWLEAQGLNDYLDKVKAINATDVQQQAIELCKIFVEEISEDEINSVVDLFKFRKEEEQRLEKFEQNKFKKGEIINSYHKEYEELCQNMERNAEKYSFLKTAISMIYQKYYRLFKLNHIDFYIHYSSNYPLIVLSVLANEKMRSIFMEDKTLSFTDLLSVSNNFELKRDFQSKHDTSPLRSSLGGFWSKVKLEVNKSLESINNTSSQIYNLSNNPIRKFSGVTDGYWKALRSSDQKIMVISMVEGNLVRNTGKTGEELKASDVNGKFLLLNGLDYKSNNENHQLVFMEVDFFGNTFYF